VAVGAACGGIGGPPAAGSVGRASAGAARAGLVGRLRRDRWAALAGSVLTRIFARKGWAARTARSFAPTR